MIYHITSRAAWEQAQREGRYSPQSLESEGFIHCSSRAQVLSVANAIFRGQKSLVLLCLEESKLSAELRWEAPAHPHHAHEHDTRQDALFPHLYGILNLDAVVGIFDLIEAQSGYKLPNDLP